MIAPHVHVGVVEFITVACYVVIFSFFWRVLSARLSDRPVGRAMAAVYS